MSDTDQKASGTYRIPAERLLKLREQIAKLNRRAAKLGVPEVELEVGEQYAVPFIRGDGGLVKISAERAAELRDISNFGAFLGTVVYRDFSDVTVSGQAPKLAGWEFVATLEHLEVEGERQNLLRTVPGAKASLPERFRTAGPGNCDHCQLLRRRRDTYVVHHEGGEWKQVGKTCVSDFLGGADPEKILASLAILASAADLCDEGESGGWDMGSSPSALPTEDFLAFVAACVRIDGFTSRGKAREMEGMGVEATADQVLELTLFPPKSPSAKWAGYREAHQPTAADAEVASKALEYVHGALAEKVARDGDDYLHNLWVASRQEYTGSKLAGIVASLIPHYNKEVERQVLREAEAKQLGASTFVGALGDRPILTATILKVITVGQLSEWGPSLLHKAVTSDGNAVSWFQQEGGLTVGETVEVKGTVKKHEVRDGVEVTTLNRVVVLTAEAVAAERAKAAKKAARAAKKAAAGSPQI